MKRNAINQKHYNRNKEGIDELISKLNSDEERIHEIQAISIETSETDKQERIKSAKEYPKIVGNFQRV